MSLPEEAETLGLLGGTFDPVHRGHVAIIKSFLDSGFLDHLIVTLTPKPPHKGGREFAGYEHRYKMLELALKGIANMDISTIEKELPEPSYTLHTIRRYLDKYPRAKLYLCLGEDSLKEFKSWYKWEEILKACSLLVARRPDQQEADIPEDLKMHTNFIDHHPVDISSTEIRNRLKAGKAVDGLLPATVLAYIKMNNLYNE